MITSTASQRTGEVTPHVTKEHPGSREIERSETDRTGDQGKGAYLKPEMVLVSGTQPERDPGDDRLPRTKSR